MGEPTPEQLAEEAKAEEARKAEEAKNNPPPPAQPAPGMGGMTEDQIKALENQTGFNRQQLVTMGVMNQQSLTSNPQIAEILQDRAMEKGRSALINSGIQDAARFEAGVKAKLEKLSPQDRVNPVLIENLFWIERGKDAAKADPTKIQTKVMRTGTDTSAAGGGDETQTKDLSSLTELEQYVAQRSNITTLEEWEKYKGRGINTDYERNWKPILGGK